MGRLAQAAAHQPGRLHPQPLQHRQGGGGAPRHTLRQQQRLGGVPALSPVAAALQQGLHPGRIEGPAGAEAAGRAGALERGQAQVRHRWGDGTAQIHHPGAFQQPQLPQHHMADQGWAHPGRQGRQGMNTPGARPLQQQLGVGGGRAQPGLGGGPGGGNPRHRCRVGGGQQQQGAAGRPTLLQRCSPAIRGHRRAQRGSRATRARRAWGGSGIGERRRGKIQ